MTPGPTRIPQRVLLAGNEVLHHRTPEFSDALGETLAGLTLHFGTASADILPVHATGRASMEAALLNLLSPGATVVACCNGKFGQMWAGFAERHRFEVVRVAESWDRSVEPDAVADALEHASAAAVLICHSDTSTGVLNPVSEVARAARERDALVMVDGISSVAGVPFAFDAWDVDVAVTSSQKCLMSSPGISFVAVSGRAWEAASAATSIPPAYLDFASIRGALAGERPETPGTTPVSLVLQVREALRAMSQDDEPQTERNRGLAATVRGWALQRGFALQGGDGLSERSPTLTALLPPPGVDAARLREALRARGVLVAGGLGPYRGRALRVGHMGDIREADVARTLDALDAALEQGALA